MRKAKHAGLNELAPCVLAACRTLPENSNPRAPPPWLYVPLGSEAWSSLPFTSSTS